MILLTHQIANSLNHLLSQLDLTPTQSEIFLYLYQFGPKPASSVAKYIHGERTNVYKTIETMMRHGLLAEQILQSVKHFFVPDKHIFRHQIAQQQESLSSKAQVLPLLEQELAKLDQSRLSPLPPMRLYSGKEDCELMIEDIIQTIQNDDYKMIRCFATNTLESQAGPKRFADYGQKLIDFLHTQHIATELYLGNGILLLEQLIKSDGLTLGSVPAGESAMMILIVGSIVYIILFKKTPAAIKIESQELASVVVFLLKQV